MPSPVSFITSIAPLTANWVGSAQDLLDALETRLTVTPAEPWSSFQNGGTIPASDVGPVLYEGREWRTWNSGTGAYDFHRQNGAGLVDATVTNAKLAAGTAGSLLKYNAEGRPVEITAASGTSGQVLTLVSGVPLYADTFVPGKEYFEVTASTDQDLNTNGSVQVVSFNTVRDQANVVFDTVNFRVNVVAGTVWFFYVSLQIEDTGAASTETQVQIDIRRSGASSGLGTVAAYDAVQSRFGAYTGGLLKFTSDGYVDVSVTPTETTPSATGLAIAGNATNTRFGGYRVI